MGRQPGDALTGLRDAAALEIEQKSGALESLGPIARAGLDLVRIDSRPIPATPWSYRFDAVIAGHPLDTAVRTALAELGEMTRSHRVLGVYEAAEEAK